MSDENPHRARRGTSELNPGPYRHGGPLPARFPRAGFSKTPYRPATADDVIAVTGGSTRAVAVRSAEANAKAPPPRVDAAPKAASEKASHVG